MGRDTVDARRPAARQWLKQNQHQRTDMIAQRKPTETRQTMRVEHRAAIKSIQSEADNIAGAARKLADMCGEVLTTGGRITVAAQANFLTGAMLRLVKDLGVLEHLQAHGVVQFKAPDTRR